MREINEFSPAFIDFKSNMKPRKDEQGHRTDKDTGLHTTSLDVSIENQCNRGGDIQDMIFIL